MQFYNLKKALNRVGVSLVGSLMRLTQILCASVLLASCGAGSVDGDPELGAATGVVDSEWIEQVVIEPSNSTRLIIRALDLYGAGPWSEPVEFDYLLSDAEQPLSGIDELKQKGLWVEWEPTPGAYGYEILAVNSVTGEVLGEHTLPAEFACSENSCKVQPEQPSVSTQAVPLVASINNANNEGVAPYTVELSAYSDDVAESAVGYSWTVSGQFAEGNSDSFFEYTFFNPGVYRVKLEIKDDVGSTAVDYASVTVLSLDDQDNEGNLDIVSTNAAYSYLNAAEEVFGFQLIPTVNVDSQSSVVSVPAPVLYVNTNVTVPLVSNAAPSSVPIAEKPIVALTPNNTSTVPTAVAGLQLPASVPVQVAVIPTVSTVNTAPIQAAVKPVPNIDNSAPVQAAVKPAPNIDNSAPIQAAVNPASNTVHSAQLQAANNVQAAINASNNTAPVQVSTKPETPIINLPPVLLTAPPVLTGSSAIPELATANPIPTGDTTAPTIDSVKITDIGYDSVVVIWVLNELVTGQVEYGTTSALGSTSTKEESFRWATHIQRLTNLSPGTKYYYRVTSADSSGNDAVSQIQTFSTPESVSVPNPPEVIAAPTLVPENWPDNTNGELPLAGIFYGNHASGIGAQNSGIGVEGSRRFRAERSGAITYVRYQNRTLNMANINLRCDRNGPGSDWCDCVDAGLDEYSCGYTLGSSYHVGNGGTLVVELRTNTSDGLPSDVVLGKTAPFVPMDNKSTPYPALQFTSPVTLQEGVIYHLVFTNLTPPTSCTALVRVAPSEASSCPRNQGAQGLNGIRLVSVPSTTGLRGPYLGDSAAANFYRRTAQSDWKYYPSTLSWYELGYTDGVAAGFTYYTVGSMGTGKRTINGAIKARQIFTVMDASRAVDGLWLNFSHTSTADGSSLKAVLKNESGSTLATGSLTSSKYCRDTIREGTAIMSHWCQDWAYTSFGKVVSLIEGSTYSVEFSAGANAGFSLSANQTLTDHGFSDRNHWARSEAELSTNNGASWGDWTSDKPAGRDLSLLFTIQGMPRQLQ